MRREKALAGFAVVLLALLVGGCPPPSARRGGLAATAPTVGMMSVERLAGRLGMCVVETDAVHVEFADFEDAVLIRATQPPTATINGLKEVPIEGLQVWQGRFFVAKSLEGTLREVLNKPVAGSTKPTVMAPLQDLSRTKVMLDPGHGGRDPGTRSARGYQEKAHNLAVAERVGAILARQGVQVVWTRRDDRFVELDARVRQANYVNPTLFVSIHADHARDHSVQGFTLYVARGASKKTWAAAHSLRRAMSQMSVKSRGIRKANFRVLKYTRCPAVLIEAGYMSNPYEAVRLASAQGQKALAESIAAGIIEFLRQS